MRRKIERLERIERLRKRLHELSAWRLAVVTQEREKLTLAHKEMIEALSEGLMAFGPASVAGTRRVRRLETELAQAGAAEKAMEKRTLDDGRMAKLAEGSLDAARETFREKEERRSLEELIEATIPTGTAPRKS